MAAKRILILGGTSDARALATQLVALRQDVVTSLAGVTHEPIHPPGRVRVGGFGGSDGLVEYLRAEKIDAVVDATHPFAAQMSIHAVAAAAQTETRLVRLLRPAWVPEAGDDWRDVVGMTAAIEALPFQARVFVTTGHKGLEGLLARDDLSGLIRAIEPLAGVVPSRWQVMLDRPPFSFQHEVQLLKQHSITHLLTKNSGGLATAAKLVAARSLRLPVIMIGRPVKAAAPTYSSIAEVLAALA